jgi:hypothetical protein
MRHQLATAVLLPLLRPPVHMRRSSPSANRSSGDNSSVGSVCPDNVLVLNLSSFVGATALNETLFGPFTRLHLQGNRLPASRTLPVSRPPSLSRSLMFRSSEPIADRPRGSPRTSFRWSKTNKTGRSNCRFFLLEFRHFIPHVRFSKFDLALELPAAAGWTRTVKVCVQCDECTRFRFSLLLYAHVEAARVNSQVHSCGK